MTLIDIVFLVMCLILCAILCKRKQYLAAVVVVALCGLVFSITTDIKAEEHPREPLTLKTCDRWC